MKLMIIAFSSIVKYA